MLKMHFLHQTPPPYEFSPAPPGGKEEGRRGGGELSDWHVRGACGLVDAPEMHAPSPEVEPAALVHPAGAGAVTSLAGPVGADGEGALRSDVGGMRWSGGLR